MKVKTDDAAGRGLRQKAAVVWLLSGVLIIITVGSILLYRNPWIVHRMNASQASAEVLNEIADSRSPYIKIDGMNLTFTGYYKVSSSGSVCSYCYLGTVGDQYVLVDLPVEDEGAMAEDETAENAVLENYTLSGQLVKDCTMTAALAEAEGMTGPEYQLYYQMLDLEILDYASDQERIRIYQLMMAVMAAGLLAVGRILISEAKIAERETQDKNI